MLYILNINQEYKLNPIRLLQPIVNKTILNQYELQTIPKHQIEQYYD
jgi:hypothetical protein